MLSAVAKGSSNTIELPRIDRLPRERALGEFVCQQLPIKDARPLSALIRIRGRCLAHRTSGRGNENPRPHLEHGTRARCRMVMRPGRSLVPHKVSHPPLLAAIIQAESRVDVNEKPQPVCGTGARGKTPLINQIFPQSVSHREGYNRGRRTAVVATKKAPYDLKAGGYGASRKS
jgi:hypothetical protein